MSKSSFNFHSFLQLFQSLAVNLDCVLPLVDGDDYNLLLFVDDKLYEIVDLLKSRV